MLLHIRFMNIYQHFELLIEQPFSYKLLHEFCMACKWIDDGTRTHMELINTPHLMYLLATGLIHQSLW
jgi:hypothetical protein